jgi:hypothetical protein
LWPPTPWAALIPAHQDTTVTYATDDMGMLK